MPGRDVVVYPMKGDAETAYFVEWMRRKPTQKELQDIERLFDEASFSNGNHEYKSRRAAQR